MEYSVFAGTASLAGFAVMTPLFLLTLVLKDAWLVPIIGTTASCFALLFGWWFFTGRSRRRAFEPNEPIEAIFLLGVTQERRALPRRKGNTVEVQLASPDGSTVRGWILDRSQGGLGVLVEQPLTEGTPLKVRPSTAAATVPWTEVTVRSCRRDGHQYEVGCQFDHLPNWNELLHFG